MLSLFDAYDRRARFFPAVLALLPLLGVFILFHLTFFESIQRAALFVIIGGALAYLLAQIARERGMLYQESFVEHSGGWQSTILLRHSDDSIDVVTKSRYHETLGDLSGLDLPTADEEQADPVAADLAYRSASKVLIERRRGPEFAILHSENAGYGFWRNLMGLRTIAVALATTMIALSIGILIGIDHDFSSLPSFLKKIDLASVETIAYEATYIVLVFLLVRLPYVKGAARAYAFALLKSLDAAPESTS